MVTELVEHGARLHWTEPLGDGLQHTDELRRPATVELSQSGGQSVINRDSALADDLASVLGADLYQETASVGGVGLGLDQPLFVESGDGLGDDALGQARAGGDVSDRAVRMSDDVP